MAQRMDYVCLVAHARTHSTPAQLAMLDKAIAAGWVLTKVVGHRDTGKYAHAVCLRGTAAWITPDGKLDRAPVGRQSAQLKLNTLR